MTTGLLEALWRLGRHPRPYRAAVFNRLWQRRHPLDKYPAYRFCIDRGAELAVGLGQRGITAIEFGVAGGNGLVAMEEYARDAERRCGISIDVVGFDAGDGLPAPKDYRDLPYRWGRGYYPMDVDKLKRRLTRARLELGSVAETVRSTKWAHPIGAVAIDVDYYSSTVDALTVFDHAPTLPRVPVYFDDLWLATPFTGEWAAITDYNRTHECEKITQTWALARGEGWKAQVFEWHRFDHPDYATLLTKINVAGQLPLSE